MTLDVREDRDHEFGHAVLDVTGVFDADSVRGLAIVREGADEAHLGPRGWQAEPATVQPLSIDVTPSGLRMLIGPDVNDHLEEEQVLIDVVGAGQSGRVFWPFVVPSPDGEAAVRIATPELRAPEPAPDPTPAPIPAAPVRVTPIAVAPVAVTREAEPEPQPEAEPQPQPEAEPQPQPEAEPDVEPHVARGPWPWITFALVVAALAGGLAWYVLAENERIDVVPGPVVADPVMADPVVADPAAATPPTDAPDYAARYGELVAADPQGRDLAALYREIMDTAEPDTDTAFRALFLAAQRGDGQAALALGRAYAGGEPRFDLGINPARAVANFDAARAAGIEGVDEAEAALCETVRAARVEDAEAFADFDGCSAS